MKTIHVKPSDDIDRIKTPDKKNEEDIENKIFYNIKFKDVLIESFLNASGHGIPRLFKKSYPILIRLTWLILILASYGYCFYIITTTMIQYLKFDLQSNIQIIYQNPIEFPAIDICNLSPYDYDNANKIISIFVEENNITYKNFTTKSQRDNLLNRMLTQIEADFRANNNNSIFYDKLINKLNELSDDYLREDLINLFKLSYDLKETMIDCKFNNLPCTVNDFYLYHNFYYGNCYRFNGGLNYSMNKIDILSTNIPGWKYGLQIELKKSKAIISYRSGFRILINNQTTNFYAFPEEDGISVSPGFTTNIALSKTYFETMPWPYTNCLGNLADSKFKYLIDQSHILRDMRDLFRLDYYNQKICLKLCHQKSAYLQCNCVDVTANVYLLYSNNTCNDDLELKCIENFEKNYFSNNTFQTCRKFCPENCFSTKYDYKLSFSRYPTEWFLNTFYGLKPDADPDYIPDDNSTEEAEIVDSYFEHKGVLLNVYFDDLSYTHVTYLPVIVSDSLLGLLGGQLGKESYLIKTH